MMKVLIFCKSDGDAVVDKLEGDAVVCTLPLGVLKEVSWHVFSSLWMLACVLFIIHPSRTEVVCG